MTEAARQPRGIATGGQFAPTAHPEPKLSLVPDPLGAALDISSLEAGQTRVIPVSVHQLDGVESVNIHNHGAVAVRDEQRTLISLDYELPATANIAELYSELSDDDPHGVRAAAESVLEDRLGIGLVKATSYRPADKVSVENGDVRLTSYEVMYPGESVDPDDLTSWASDLQDFSDPRVRAEIAQDIAEDYRS